MFFIQFAMNASVDVAIALLRFNMVYQKSDIKCIGLFVTYPSVIHLNRVLTLLFANFQYFWMEHGRGEIIFRKSWILFRILKLLAGYVFLVLFIFLVCRQLVKFFRCDCHMVNNLLSTLRLSSVLVAFLGSGCPRLRLLIVGVFAKHK